MPTLTTLPSPLPSPPALAGCSHPASSSTSPTSRSLLSSSPSTSSYTASLPPTYRRSSFPISPHLLPNSSSPSATLAPAFTFLPGLHLHQHGCSDDTDYSHPSTDDRFAALKVQHGGFTTPTTSSRLDPDSSSSSSSHAGSSSSRKSSASSFDSSTCTNDSGTHTPLSSLAGSVVDLPAPSCTRISGLNATSSTPTPTATASGLSAFDWTATPPPPTAAPLAGPSGTTTTASSRSLSVGSGMDKARREAVKGWEDPALAAARRALWDDVPDEVVEVQQNGDAKAPAVFVEEEEEEGEEVDEGEEEWQDEEDDEDSWQLPPARPPTSPPTPTAPLHSCLRNSSSSRSATSLSLSISTSLPSTSGSASASSSSLSLSHSQTTSPTASSPASSLPLSLCPSVSFSPDPPHTCATYSKRAYSRRGDAPVEKLSIREWMELQGVREAVGVWSGKIDKWDEAAAAAVGAPGACVATGAHGVGAEKKGRTPCPLAAVVGVVQVARSTPNSPTSPARGLPDF